MKSRHIISRIGFGLENISKLLVTLFTQDGANRTGKLLCPVGTLLRFQVHLEQSGLLLLVKC